MINVNKLLELNASGYTQKEMAKLLKVSRSTVQRTLRRYHIKTPNYHNAVKFDNCVFDIIDTEEKAYWLGFLYADGAVGLLNNNVELSLAIKDISHLEKFKNFIKSPKDINISTVIVGGKCFKRCRLTVTDKHFKTQLIKCGCHPKKSFTITFPDENIVPKQLIAHFIRGYVDGDGCISFCNVKDLKISIIGTIEFLTSIRTIYPNIFSECKKDKRWKGNTYYICAHCSKANKVLTNLYKNSNIYLQRKYNRLAVLSSNW